MSTMSNTTWYFTDDNHEPFLNKPLKENYITENSRYPSEMWASFIYSLARTTNSCKPFHSKINECTFEQIQAKLEYLIKNILLLRSECEVIELNSIKVQPELITSNTIDVSWMPFDDLPPVVTKIPKIPKEKFRQSVISVKSNISVFSNMYNVVINAITVNKISIHQMIAEVEKAAITLEKQFEKLNFKMIKNLDKIEIETENIELEIIRQLKHIETYRTNVLVAGFNKLTKRIPAEKYEKFVKEKIMSSSIYLNDIKFKIKDALAEQEMLRKNYVTSKQIQNTVFNVDMRYVRILNKKLLKEQTEIIEKNKKLKYHLSVVRQNCLVKKYDLKKFELSLNLPTLDTEIKHYRKKLLRVTPITQKIIEKEESRSKNKNDKGDNDDDDENDKYELNETEEDRINHYLKLKRSIEKTERDIKTIKLKIDRTNNLVELYESILRKKNIIVPQITL